MDPKVNKLAKNAVIYSVFTFLQRGLGFFLLPVYTAVLEREQLGIISTAMAVIPLLVIVFGLSFRGSTAYYYYQYKDTAPKYLKRLFGTNVSFILLFSILGIFLLLLSKKLFLDRLFLNISFSPYVILSLISIFFQPLYFYYQSLLKAKQQARTASVLDLIYFSTTIGLTLVLILIFDFNAEGALLANAIASSLVFVFSLAGLYREIEICLEWSLLKKSLKYSLPILPHNLSGWAMNMVDRILLNSINSLSIVALFDVGAQLGKVVNMISLGVNSAYSPWFFDQVKSGEDAKGNIARVTNKIVLLYVLFAIVISWVSPELLRIISKPEYHESWKIVPFIASAFVLNGFYFTFSNIFFLNKTHYLPFITVFGAIINIGLNLLLIPKYGFFGAAYASILTKVIFSTATYVVSQRLYTIPYRLSYLVPLIIAGFVFSCLPFTFQHYFERFNVWIVISCKCLLLGVLLSPIFINNISAIKNLVKN
ncbi:MAG: oligosaccharide flippase family protein [Maribacter sp.]|nr:oligosaccharide flippase family protein [Maribacter sp.]